VTEIINRLRNLGNQGKNILNNLPLERLQKLWKEMLSQYNLEKYSLRREYSSYFKTLVCLNITKRLVKPEETGSEALPQPRVTSII
jgi:hypothetical protein